MTDRQKKFAEEYVVDLDVTRAYRAAYPKVKRDDTARKLGSRLMTNDDVSAYIEELRESFKESRILKAEERMEILSDIAKDKYEKTQDRVKAIDTLNKMTGEYVTKIEGSISAEVNDPFAGLTTEELRKLAGE